MGQSMDRIMVPASPSQVAGICHHDEAPPKAVLWLPALVAWLRLRWCRAQGDGNSIHNTFSDESNTVGASVITNISASCF